MTDSSARTFSGDFRRFFLRGLVVLLPSVLTLWIVVKAYQFVDGTIAEPINQGVRMAILHTSRVWEPMRTPFNPSDEAVDEEFAELARTSSQTPNREAILLRLRSDNIDQWWQERWYMDLIGIAVAIVGVYVAGRLLGGLIGRRIYRKVENLITQLPFFKQVYPYVKQIVDFLFSDDRPIKFNRVVAIEYPRKGIWSVGFTTGTPMRKIQAKMPDAITVFVPSSPTPFTGYTITVPREDAIELPITVEEAIRFAVSGGVLVPGNQLDDDEKGAAGQPSQSSGLIPLAPPPTPTPIPPAEASEEKPNEPEAQHQIG